jgi:hypothetical protein
MQLHAAGQRWAYAYVPATRFEVEFAGVGISPRNVLKLLDHLCSGRHAFFSLSRSNLLDDVCEQVNSVKIHAAEDGQMDDARR